MECARPRTQVMDIVFAAALVVEKDLDLMSHGALAQADVRQHYDSLYMLRIFRWLVHNGCDPALAACALRQQLVPSLCIVLGGSKSHIRNRCMGGLTGSRVSGQLGRIPVIATLRKRLDDMRQICWKHQEIELVAATFVDNVFFVGATVFKATKLGRMFEDTRLADWNQLVKASSKQVLATHGNQDLDAMLRGQLLSP